MLDDLEPVSAGVPAEICDESAVPHPTPISHHTHTHTETDTNTHTHTLSLSLSLSLSLISKDPTDALPIWYWRSLLFPLQLQSRTPHILTQRQTQKHTHTHSLSLSLSLSL